MFFTVINKCTDLKKNNYELKKKQANKPKNLFRYGWKITGVALNNNHSLNLNVKHAEVFVYF
jgi:hypothetical protein